MSDEELTETGEEPEVEESVPPEETNDVVDEPETEGQAEGEPEGKPAENKGFQKRINKLTAEKYAERSRAENAESELARIKSSPPAPGNAPKLEDFDYDEDKYLEAKIDFKVNQSTVKLNQESSERQRQQKEDQENREYEKRVNASGIDQEAYRKAAHDLIDLKVPYDLVKTIQQDENGPEIVVYLGNNLDIVDKIADLSPLNAAREIGKISIGLTAKPNKKITNAPNPVKTAGSGGKSSKSLENMSTEEFMNRHN